MEWRQEEHQEIFQLLLSKLDNEDIISYEAIEKENTEFLEEKYWDEVKEEIKDGVYEKLNE
jgi:hypothetical protein